jgi:citrate synthase
MLDSSITLISGDQLYYRGEQATRLARSSGFEAAVAFVWRSGGEVAFHAPSDLVDRVRGAARLLGPSRRTFDRLTLTVVIAGSFDGLRDELSQDTALSAGERIISAMVDSLGEAGVPDHGSGEAPAAERLWTALTGTRATEADVRLLDAALVLCIDHDLAAATLAARVAASARANPYAAVASALGAFDSSLHGSASVAGAAMVRDALESGRSERAIATQIAAGRGIPGFGHRLYREADPRAEFLFAAMERLPRYADALGATRRLIATVRSRTSRVPNLDLALATLAIGAGMADDAGQTLFAIARTAGWIAHIVDEYAQDPLRLRPESRYDGPRPEPE